jgi:DNA-binding PadR family transcriptional regulator
MCVVPVVTIASAFLALLDGRPHGYDQHFRHDRPVHYGQVYTTLAKLLKNGLVTVDGTEGDGGPDRKRYTITDAGVTDVERWLGEPEKPDQYPQSTLYAKMIGALLTGRSGAAVLNVQREEHLVAMRWPEHTSTVLGELAEQVRR